MDCHWSSLVWKIYYEKWCVSIRLSYLDLMKTSQGEPYSFGGSKFMNASSGEGWSVTLWRILWGRVITWDHEDLVCPYFLHHPCCEFVILVNSSLGRNFQRFSIESLKSQNFAIFLNRWSYGVLLYEIFTIGESSGWSKTMSLMKPPSFILKLR